MLVARKARLTRKAPTMPDRLSAFEQMLADLLERERTEKAQIDALRAQGRDKTATFRQLMSNRLVLTQMLALYREYGLIE